MILQLLHFAIIFSVIFIPLMFVFTIYSFTSVFYTRISAFRQLAFVTKPKLLFVQHPFEFFKFL